MPRGRGSRKRDGRAAPNATTAARSAKHLHAKGQAPALQGGQEAVHGHGRNADVLNPLAAAEMGSSDLSDRVVDAAARP